MKKKPVGKTPMKTKAKKPVGKTPMKTKAKKPNRTLFLLKAHSDTLRTHMAQLVENSIRFEALKTCFHIHEAKAHPEIDHKLVIIEEYLTSLRVYLDGLPQKHEAFEGRLREVMTQLDVLSSKVTMHEKSCAALTERSLEHDLRLDKLVGLSTDTLCLKNRLKTLEARLLWRDLALWVLGITLVSLLVAFCLS